VLTKWPISAIVALHPIMELKQSFFGNSLYTSLVSIPFGLCRSQQKAPGQTCPTRRFLLCCEVYLIIVKFVNGVAQLVDESTKGHDEYDNF
jgi:hypothetical protein